MSNYQGFYMNINTNAFSKLGGSKANKYSRTKTKQRKDAGEEMILPAELFGNDKADSVHMDLVVRSIFIEGTNYMAILDTPYGTVKANFNDIIAYDMKQQLKKPNQLLKEIERLIGKVKDKQTEALKRERKAREGKEMEAEYYKKVADSEREKRYESDRKRFEDQMEYEKEIYEKSKEADDLKKENTELKEENTGLRTDIVLKEKALDGYKKAVDAYARIFSMENIEQYGEYIKMGMTHEEAIIALGMVVLG